MQFCTVYRPGLLDYAAAWQLQQQFALARARATISDSLLLLEHPHTYTLGSSGKQANLLLSEAERTERQIALYEVDRGGDITYHGPGQVVGYPVLQLPQIAGSDGRLRTDVIAYIRQLETLIIDVVARYGIHAQRLNGYTGVWIQTAQELAKIAAIGVKVTTRRITMHGFALNVNTDLSYFEGIIPCGIDDKPVTSLATLLDYSVDIQTIMDEITQDFARIFDYQLQSGHSEILETFLSADIQQNT